MPIVTGPLLFFQKMSLMGCVALPFIGSCPSHLLSVYKIMTLPSLIRCGTFLITVTLSPTQSYDALVSDETPYLPHPASVEALGKTSKFGLGWL